jgi:pyruvate/2-oxoglutarate dehydrogenase complex dihydrolipoamide dehydrogenase (E3) component
MPDPINIAVVGAGPGGYAAAFLAADLGMSVTLIDPEVNPGGVCLYRGCIPSKSLLHVAKLIEESEQAKNWGIDFAAPKTRSKTPPRCKSPSPTLPRKRSPSIASSSPPALAPRSFPR